MRDKRPSIKVVLYKSKTLSNGEHPIMLSVSYNGKRKYKSLGISCTDKYWDKDANDKVNKSHPQAKLLNRAIQIEINKAQKQYLDYENNDKQYSAKTIIEGIAKDAPSTKTLYELLDERIEHFHSIDSNNTADGYSTFKSALMRYLTDKDVELFSIDEEWIAKFEQWLRKSYKDTSIKKFFDCFKAAMNHAVKKKFIEKSPLDGYEHVKKLNLKTKKRALSIVEITKLTKYYYDSYGLFGERSKPVEEKCKKHYWNKKFRRRGTTKLTPIDAEQLSLALFLCSYYFQGLALVDMAKLKWKDLKEVKIRDERKFAYDSASKGYDYAITHQESVDCYQIDVERSKTGKSVTIVVECGNVLPYLNPFYPDELNSEAFLETYVFPIYSELDDTERKKYGRMKYATYLVNVNLKRIGENLNIPELTFYAARHSYASNLYHADVPTSLIAQNMGRSTSGIETYLKNFEQTKILEANKKALIIGQDGFRDGLKDRPIDEGKKRARRELGERMKREREEAEKRVIEKFGSIEAYNIHLKERERAIEEELEQFGEDNRAKVEFLKAKLGKGGL